MWHEEKAVHKLGVSNIFKNKDRAKYVEDKVDSTNTQRQRQRQRQRSRDRETD